MNPTMNLPEAIRHARKDLGLSQDALARLAGTQPCQISRLEHGRSVTLNTLKRVLRQLPNLHAFRLDTAGVEVSRTRSTPWNEGAVAAAAYLAKACQHVIDRVTAPPA